jgi:hypothetical protein
MMSSGWRIFSPLAEVESPPIAPSSSLKIFSQPNEKPCRLFDGGRRRHTHTATAAVLSPPPLRIDYVNPCLKAGPVTTQRVEMGVAQLCQKLKEKSRDNKTTQKILYYNPPLLTKSIAHYTTSTHTHTHPFASLPCVCVCVWGGGRTTTKDFQSEPTPHTGFFSLAAHSRVVYIF